MVIKQNKSTEGGNMLRINNFAKFLVIIALVIASTTFSQNKPANLKEKKTEKTDIVRKGIIDLASVDKNKDGKVFQCPMELNVISDSQGNCPLCGMKLREISVEDAKAKLIKKGFEVKKSKSTESSKSEEKENKVAQTIWNKVCPVMGEEVDPKAPTQVYNGKVIGFCCPGCDKKFQKDPAKYIKNLSEDGTTFIGKK
jgi:YHS domain-containing protein